MISLYTGRASLRARGLDNKHIKLSWGKIEEASGYRIYRSTKATTGFSLIKTVSGSVATYKNKVPKSGKIYYYKITALDKEKKPGRESNVVKIKTLIKINKSYNKKYAKKSRIWRGVCMDSTNINKYTVNGKKPAIKYRFTGKELQIHIYVHYVTYKKQGGKYKRISNPKSKLGKEYNYKLFEKGVKRFYSNQYIVGSKGDFKTKVAFKTKVVFHTKGTAGQQFVEVRIGNECSNGCNLGEKGNYWFHMEFNNKGQATIFMPTNSQLIKNRKDELNGAFTAQEYSATGAHEMGHVLGLADAYPTRGIDRCADNIETATQYEPDNYNNIMRNQYILEHIQPNDIEMMLCAYSGGKGIPWYKTQAYKTYNKNKVRGKISKVIKDKKDYQKDH